MMFYSLFKHKLGNIFTLSYNGNNVILRIYTDYAVVKLVGILGVVFRI